MQKTRAERRKARRARRLKARVEDARTAPKSKLTHLPGTPLPEECRPNIIRQAASPAMADAAVSGGLPAWPMPGHAKSRARVSTGLSPGTNRWTPAINVKHEDYIDLMTSEEAERETANWPSAIRVADALSLSKSAFREMRRLGMC